MNLGLRGSLKNLIYRPNGLKMTSETPSMTEQAGINGTDMNHVA